MASVKLKVFKLFLYHTVWSVSKHTAVFLALLYACACVFWHVLVVSWQLSLLGAFHFPLLSPALLPVDHLSMFLQLLMLVLFFLSIDHSFISSPWSQPLFSFCSGQLIVHLFVLSVGLVCFVGLCSALPFSLTPLPPSSASSCISLASSASSLNWSTYCA